MIRESYHPLLVWGKKCFLDPEIFTELTDRIEETEQWCDWVPLCTCICVLLWAHKGVRREALHTSSLTHFLPNTICKGEIEAILLLLWPPSTEALIIVAASCHIHPCGTYCIYPAWIFHEYWGSNCNVRHNAYFRWHMTDVFRDLGLLCTCNIIYYQKAGLFPYCTD